MKAKEWLKNTRLGRGLARFLGDVRGAVAMEYIVIALLIGAAVVALVMVFGGNIRNMFAKTNDVMTSTTVSDVQSAGTAHRQEQNALHAKTPSIRRTHGGFDVDDTAVFHDCVVLASCRAMGACGAHALDFPCTVILATLLGNSAGRACLCAISAALAKRYIPIGTKRR